MSTVEREWRNRQTRTFEGRVGRLVRVQVPSLAPKIADTIWYLLFFYVKYWYSIIQMQIVLFFIFRVIFNIFEKKENILVGLVEVVACSWPAYAASARCFLHLQSHSHSRPSVYSPPFPTELSLLADCGSILRLLVGILHSTFVCLARSIRHSRCTKQICAATDRGREQETARGGQSREERSSSGECWLEDGWQIDIIHCRN